jgi:hypothetical protein
MWFKAIYTAALLVLTVVMYYLIKAVVAMTMPGWWHNNVTVPIRKRWGRLWGYNYCCCICGMPIKTSSPMLKTPWLKSPYWKYCPYCGDQIWFDTPEGTPTQFGLDGEDYVAYSQILTDENAVEIYDKHGKRVWHGCEPMSTEMMIGLFTDEIDAANQEDLDAID